MNLLIERLMYSMKKISLNELLLSMSYVLDFVEMDVLGVASNHSKRVA